MLNQYVLSTVDANGCYLRDSASIKVEPLFGTISPEEADVCFGDAIPLNASGGTQYQWFDNPQLSGTPNELTCTLCPDPVATPPSVGDKSYYVLITDNQGCRDTLISLLHVNPLPDIVVQPHDTIIKYGDGFTLYATGGVNYIWSPAGSLSDPSSSAPYASPIKNTDYVVIGTSTKGCLAADTAHVIIDYRTPVLVPNAFSPNGDGLNDVFKVENITSQKILVFQVYDRWGKLVFETQDPDKGWDGMYKNKPMNSDVYQYYIKLAYPDDYMQEFKGNVTLIR
jgi:gliding motility-associated-like protein